jgi:hypothetical protein
MNAISRRDIPGTTRARSVRDTGVTRMSDKSELASALVDVQLQLAYHESVFRRIHEKITGTRLCESATPDPGMLVRIVEDLVEYQERLERTIRDFRRARRAS